MPQKLPESKIERIQELYAEGKSRNEISNELNISHNVVSKYCSGVSRDDRERERKVVTVTRESKVKEATYEILRQVMRKGYFRPAESDLDDYAAREVYKELKEREFPIQRTETSTQQVVYHHEDRAKEAMKQTVENLNKKVISCQELGRLASAFGDKTLSKSLVGNYGSHEPSSKGSGSEERGIQRGLDDFVGRFLPS